MKNFFRYSDSAQCLFNISGSFGRIEGEIKKTDNGYFSENADVSVATKIHKHKSGIISRIDTVTNHSEDSIHLNALESKFVFDGDEYSHLYPPVQILLHRRPKG